MDHALFALVLLAAIGSGFVGGIFYAFSSFVMKALGRIQVSLTNNVFNYLQSEIL